MEELKLLDSLVEITSNKDISLLEKSLVNSINNLYPYVDLRMFIIKNIGANISVHLIACSDDGTKILPKNYLNKTWNSLLQTSLKKVMFTNHIVDFYSEKTNTFHSIYPVINEKNEILSVLLLSSNKALSGEKDVISGFLKIYSNYLTLLNKTQRDKLTG
tara:strand:- start:68 stop:547 length:480 start_codon:yes stop_codon:yes gene_type:complete